MSKRPHHLLAALLALVFVSATCLVAVPTRAAAMQDCLTKKVREAAEVATVRDLR